MAQTPPELTMKVVILAAAVAFMTAITAGCATSPSASHRDDARTSAARACSRTSATAASVDPVMWSFSECMARKGFH